MTHRLRTTNLAPRPWIPSVALNKGKEHVSYQLRAGMSLELLTSSSLPEFKDAKSVFRAVISELSAFRDFMKG